MKKVPEKLRDIATELRDAIAKEEINRIEFLYIHNCKESTNVKHELDTAVATPARLINDSKIHIAAHELGIDHLDDLCRAAEHEILVPEEVTIPNNNVIARKGKVWRAIVASMPGSWLHQLHMTHGGRLFRANYRDFLGVRNSIRNINNGIKNKCADGRQGNRTSIA